MQYESQSKIENLRPLLVISVGKMIKREQLIFLFMRFFDIIPFLVFPFLFILLALFL